MPNFTYIIYDMLTSFVLVIYSVVVMNNQNKKVKSGELLMFFYNPVYRATIYGNKLAILKSYSVWKYKFYMHDFCNKLSNPKKKCDNLC